jgi:transposase
MKIVGCDLHTRYQQIAMLDDETGELIERRLEHSNGEAKEFYTQLSGGVRVGIEATGHTRWFERLLGELGHELWIGDAARIRAAAGWDSTALNQKGFSLLPTSTSRVVVHSTIRK